MTEHNEEIASARGDAEETETQNAEGYTPEQIAEFHRVIRERLGIDCAQDPDPLIDLPDVAELAGVQPGTPGQWRQRTKHGNATVPFPEQAPGLGERFPDKPLWHAVSQIIPYLERTGHWPPGTGARPDARGARRRPQTGDRAA